MKHYHADNGRFADNGFLQSVNSKDQEITFCGVGAHHQNGIVEGKNRVLTQGARTLLLHAMRMWPQMIDSMFWPFAFKAVAERLNNLQIGLDGSTPYSLMHGLDVSEVPVKHTTHYFVQYMCWTAGSSLLVVLALQSGNQDQE